MKHNEKKIGAEGEFEKKKIIWNGEVSESEKKSVLVHKSELQENPRSQTNTSGNGRTIGKRDL